MAQRNEEFFANKIVMYGQMEQTPEVREILRMSYYDLCEALMILGRCAEAMAVATTEDQYARAAELYEAIERDDSEVCECKNPVVEIPQGVDAFGAPNQRAGMVVSRFGNPERFILSQKHGQIMPVRRCNQCGHLNCTTEMGDDVHLSQQRRASVPNTADAVVFRKHNG